SAVLLVILITGEEEAQDLRLRERLEPGTAATVIALMDSARTLELPTEPLVQKALEGESKGATGEAIVRAVRSLIHDLVTARQALGGEIGEGELLAAARSEEHTSELQSRENLVCRLLLEKKN